MVSHDRLVLKLPAARAAQLVAAGYGELFDGGKGRPMKEWISLEPAGLDLGVDVATEALEFVGSKR